MPVMRTLVKWPSELGPSSRRCPTAMEPATAVPDTTEPTPFTSNVWSTLEEKHMRPFSLSSRKHKSHCETVLY